VSGGPADANRDYAYLANRAALGALVARIAAFFGSVRASSRSSCEIFTGRARIVSIHHGRLRSGSRLFEGTKGAAQGAEKPMQETQPTGTQIASLLILGGARSGKSRIGQIHAEASGKALILIATAEAHDEEMRTRIAHHQAGRDGRWRLIEEPIAVTAVLRQEAAQDRIVVVDCLTLWLANLMLREHDYAARCRELAAAVATLNGPAIFISNEVGTGIVADNALARAFTDAQGRLNQLMAEACAGVLWVCAGLPQVLKPALSRPQLRL
jgi:adenosylcobinamide kinase/adenosylcobinamide-phosphate guanylyltransferase